MRAYKSLSKWAARRADCYAPSAPKIKILVDTMAMMGAWRSGHGAGPRALCGARVRCVAARSPELSSVCAVMRIGALSAGVKVEWGERVWVYWAIVVNFKF